MQNSKRQTGRTTRMLQEAIRLRDAGRTVYVLMANQRGFAYYETDPIYAGLRFETWDTLRGSIDERTLTLRSAHPNCVLLVDHYAIEDRYAPMLREWVRFDLKP